MLGMLWKRATPAGGFWGLLAGTGSAIAMWAWVKIDPSAVQYVALSPDAKAMAENMFRALWSWLVCVVVTVVRQPRHQAQARRELVGLVYGCTEIPSEGNLPLYAAPDILGRRVSHRIVSSLQIIFW